MGLLESYQRFAPVDFIKDLKRHEKRKKKLQIMLEEMTELPSIDNKSGVRSSKISDMTANQAIRRAEILEEIEEIERCESAHRYALSQLTDEELELFNGFFNPKIPIWKFRTQWGEKHYMGDSLVYKNRKRVIEKYTKGIKKYMGG